MLTGEGEQGLISIVIDEDPSGAAGSNAGIKATLTAKGTPAEYTYSIFLDRAALGYSAPAEMFSGGAAAALSMEENAGADMPEPRTAKKVRKTADDEVAGP